MKIEREKDVIQSYLSKYQLNKVFSEQYITYLEIHHFIENELIMKESNTANFLYIVLEGTTRVAPSSETGKIALLDFIEPLDLLGDIEYFYGDPIYHSVIARSKCVLLAIAYKHMDEVFNNNLLLYKFISESLANKIRNNSIRQSRLLLYPVKNRLSKYLFDYCEVSDTSIIKLKFNRTAEYMGITPRHFRRILSELETENILIRNKNEIKILNMDKLKSYCTPR